MDGSRQFLNSFPPPHFESNLHSRHPGIYLTTRQLFSPPNSHPSTPDRAKSASTQLLLVHTTVVSLPLAEGEGSCPSEQAPTWEVNSD